MATAKKLKSGSWRCLVYDYKHITQMKMESAIINLLLPQIHLPGADVRQRDWRLIMRLKRKASAIYKILLLEKL